MIRLQKFLAECGIASRREAEKLITAGRVKVNGQPATLGDSIDAEHDKVTFDERPVERNGKVYLILNKPQGVITSARDTHGRKTVLDCLHGVHARVFPVGRLDLDVEGALILTNDGELAYRLTHPQFQIEKVYLVWVEGVMSAETAILLEQGVKLDDGFTAPASVVILHLGKHTTLIRLVLREGKKREAKRMCAAVGHRVRELQRISIGNIRVKGLKPGEWRYLNDTEIAGLRRLTGLHP